MKLSQDLQISLTVAISEASRRGHEYAGLEHLLYALVLDEHTAGILRHAGADIGRLKKRLEAFLETELDEIETIDIHDPQPSLAFRRVIARASAQVEGAGKDELEGSDLLVAIFAENDSSAVSLLEDEGVTRFDLVRFLAHGASKLQPTIPGARIGGSSPEGAPAHEGDEAEDGEGVPEDALSAFTQDLTALAEAGELDPLIGRKQEIARTLHILHRRRKNNPI